MACEVLWTRAAEGDRDAIVAYLIEKSGGTQAAAHFLDEVDEAMGRIAGHPRMYPLSRDAYLSWLGIRVCVVMRYVLLYRQDGSEVEVMRVFHGSQDYGRLV